MKKITRGLIIGMAAMFSLGSIAPLSAGDELDSQVLINLVSGNTVESEDVPKGWRNKIYFLPDGTLQAEDENGNREKGTWNVESGNSICIDRRKHKCWKLEPAGDDVYNIHSKKSGRLKKTWRVIQGNPFEL